MVPEQPTKLLPEAPVWVMTPASWQFWVMTTRSAPGLPFLDRLASTHSFTRKTPLRRNPRQRTASVDFAGRQDGELVVRLRQALELEALIVVVHVGVGRRAGGISVLDVGAGGIRRRAHCRAGVMMASAGGVGADLEVGRGGTRGGHQGEDGGKGELHCGLEAQTGTRRDTAEAM